jgi:hypothetical protein
MIPFVIQQQKLHGSLRILIVSRLGMLPHRSHLAYAKSRAFGLQAMQFDEFEDARLTAAEKYL